MSLFFSLLSNKYVEQLQKQIQGIISYNKGDGSNEQVDMNEQDPFAMLSKISATVNQLEQSGALQGAKSIYYSLSMARQLFSDALFMLFVIMFCDAVHIIIMSGGHTHTSITIELLGIDIRF